MRKIPVGKTVSFAYNFLIHQIGTVVSLTLVPALLYAVADYINHRFAAANAVQLQQGNMQVMGTYVLISAGTLMLILFSSALAAVGVTEEVLGVSRPAGIVSFRVGHAEWRMFLATIRYFLCMIVLLGAAVLVSGVALALSGVSLDTTAPPPMPSFALLLAVAVSLAAFAYAVMSLLRMTFLLAPAVVAEEKGGLRRSNELTKGNFWRLVGVVAAVGAPIAVLAFAGELALLRAYVGPDLFDPRNAETLANRIDDAIQSRLLPWEGFLVILFMLLWGLIYSASAFAYRELTRPDASRPDSNPPL